MAEKDFTLECANCGVPFPVGEAKYYLYALDVVFCSDQCEREFNGDDEDYNEFTCGIGEV